MAHEGGRFILSGDRSVGRFGVPWGGVNTLISAHDLPPDQLRAASNVLPRVGSLRPRPGYTVFHSTTFTGTPTGIFHYLRGSADPVPVLATTTRQYKYDSGTWTDVTGTLQTATTLQPARFTTIALGTPSVNWVIHVNGKDLPTKWSGTSTFAAMTGAPTWSDVCTIADHIIGIVPPYLVQWGPIRSITSFPDLNTKSASETADAVVAIRPLGNGSAAVLYKETSLWPVTFTGAQTEATAFRIGPDPLGFWDGPASPAAVVNVDGAHVYMTVTGRIAVFTGAQHKWIADGLWATIQADMDTSKAGRIWGVHDPTNHEVHFVYPSLSVSSQMRGYVGISLPKPDQGVTSFGAFPGLLGSELSAGATIRLTDRLDRMLVAGAKSYTLSMASNADDGTPFAGYWQTGLLATQGMDAIRLDSIETFAERANGYGQLDLAGVQSWTLSTDGNVEALSKPVNLSEVDEPVTAGVGQDISGRFLGARWSFSDSTAITLRYKGATLVALKRAR